jgi:hypothetical protein
VTLQSDVDVLVELAPDARIGLFESVGLQRQLSELIARDVDLHTAHPKLPWRETTGLRNVVAGDHAVVDATLVWKTVRDDLPGLVERLAEILVEDAAP